IKLLMLDVDAHEAADEIRSKRLATPGSAHRIQELLQTPASSWGEGDNVPQTLAIVYTVFLDFKRVIPIGTSIALALFPVDDAHRVHTFRHFPRCTGQINGCSLLVLGHFY